VNSERFSVRPRCQVTSALPSHCNMNEINFFQYAGMSPSWGTWQRRNKKRQWDYELLVESSSGRYSRIQTEGPGTDIKSLQSWRSISEYEPALRDNQLEHWNSLHFLHNSYTVHHSLYNITQKWNSADLTEIKTSRSLSNNSACHLPQWSKNWLVRQYNILVSIILFSEIR
jgi:hypothetical protein